MELLLYLGYLLTIIGALYLLVALISALRPRRVSDEESNVLLKLEDRMLIDGESAADRMRKLAAICVATMQRSFGETLDYSASGVALLDRLVVRGWRGRGGTVPEDVIVALGAYVGEVLARTTRGRWVSGLTEEEPATILFLTGSEDDDALSFSPFRLVREKFAEIESVDIGLAFTALEQKLAELRAL